MNFDKKNLDERATAQLIPVQSGDQLMRARGGQTQGDAGGGTAAGRTSSEGAPYDDGVITPANGTLVLEDELVVNLRAETFQAVTFSSL